MKFFIKGSRVVHYEQVIEADDLKSAQEEFTERIQCAFGGHGILPMVEDEIQVEVVIPDTEDRDIIARWEKEFPPKKVVVSDSRDGFSLSDEAARMLKKLMPNKCYSDCLKTGLCKCDIHDYEGMDIERHDHRLVQVVETLGDDAEGWNKLKIEVVPWNADYWIEHSDGFEHVYY